jgi:hypothetical protein
VVCYERQSPVNQERRFSLRGGSPRWRKCSVQADGVSWKERYQEGRVSSSPVRILRTVRVLVLRRVGLQRPPQLP